MSMRIRQPRSLDKIIYEEISCTATAPRGGSWNINFILCSTCPDNVYGVFICNEQKVRCLAIRQVCYGVSVEV